MANCSTSVYFYKKKTTREKWKMDMKGNFKSYSYQEFAFPKNHF